MLIFDVGCCRVAFIILQYKNQASTASSKLLIFSFLLIVCVFIVLFAFQYIVVVLLFCFDDCYGFSYLTVLALTIEFQ